MNIFFHLTQSESETQQIKLFTPDFYITYPNTLDLPALSAQAGMFGK